jgi:uncharacterized Zn finger protein
LIANKKYDEAGSAAESGLKAIGMRWPGITNSLRTTIADLAAKRGDFSGVLRLKQEDFLEHPRLSSFTELLEAAAKTKNVDEMREWALRFLEMGRAPAKGALKMAFEPEDGYRQGFHGL